MSEPRDDNTHPAPLLEYWMRASSGFWSKALSMGAPGFESIREPRSPLQASSGRVQESWEAGLRTFQIMASSMQQPEAMEALFKGVGAIPDILAKLLKPAWEAFFYLQKDWIERTSRIGKSTAPYKFENLDQEAFKAWLEIYEKEFRQFLHVPQLGLIRFYQERANEAVDKFNIFQSTMAEFISVLYLPMEKSAKVMQEKLGEMAGSGKLPEKTKDYYRVWIKILEGHYMNLFKSPEYTDLMARTLNAMGDYMVARSRIMEDALQLLPLPTLKDMDECYKEIYSLKKRVKELEKQNKEDKRS